MVAGYGCPEERTHECQSSRHRRPSAPTSAEETQEAACADCGRSAGRAGRARGTGAADVFAVPLVDEREAAGGDLAESGNGPQRDRTWRQAWPGRPANVGEVLTPTVFFTARAPVPRTPARSPGRCRG